MKKIALLLILFSSFCFAQNSEKEEIQNTINSLFAAMKNADSVGVKSSFTKNAVLQTITKNNEVKTDSVIEFAKSVASIPKGSIEEKISFGSILIDGNLASVWTPYQLYFRDKFSHCGVNSFQLVKENKKWKIQYLIDTRRKENCDKN